MLVRKSSVLSTGIPESPSKGVGSVETSESEVVDVAEVEEIVGGFLVDPVPFFDCAFRSASSSPVL